MTQDEDRLNLLSIFHYVVAGLTAAFSSIFLIHVVMGIAMVCGAFPNPQAGAALPKIFGLLFILMPCAFILAGWTLAGLIIAAGVKLKRRKARTFCLVVAALECILMPFGTVLGVFTVVVLMQDSVRELFAANEPKRATANSGAANS